MQIVVVVATVIEIRTAKTTMAIITLSKELRIRKQLPKNDY
jgi:hypothetical protein